MGFRSFIGMQLARMIEGRVRSMAAQAKQSQQQIFQELLSRGASTRFGRDHAFSKIKTYSDWKSAIPIRDYEGLRNYIDRVKEGGVDVLWPGRPAYFAKTSGTTSGIKYIPISKESLPNHFGTARNAMFNHAARSGRGGWMDGRMIFLSGSPEMDAIHGIPTGRLSGIVNHQVPAWLRSHQLPSYSTNCIEDWEVKLDHIVRETFNKDMRLISGIPPWVIMYYEKLLEYTGKERILDIFPNLSMFGYGGVNYGPYKSRLEELVGGTIDSLETYPASEGFIAFQDEPGSNDLLLNTNSGIFFEFIPAQEYGSANARRFQLSEVELGVNYALILSNNAGLWAYDIGDTVEFVSIHPYRIRVTGRVHHYISAFGEHVIAKEVDAALKAAIEKEGGSVLEFTVAPNMNAGQGKPFHEWFIAFDTIPKNLEHWAQVCDASMQSQNIYYRDLIEGNILEPLRITCVPKDAFRKYMESQGKLGGQNKVPRLSNDRRVVDGLMA